MDRREFTSAFTISAVAGAARIVTGNDIFGLDEDLDELRIAHKTLKKSLCFSRYYYEKYTTWMESAYRYPGKAHEEARCEAVKALVHSAREKKITRFCQTGAELKDGLVRIWYRGVSDGVA